MLLVAMDRQCRYLQLDFALEGASSISCKLYTLAEAGRVCPQVCPKTLQGQQLGPPFSKLQVCMLSHKLACNHTKTAPAGHK